MYNLQLDIFICVADCGSFSKAAEKLYVSSTAVMKQMNLLESRLQLKLLQRTNHGVRLTTAGEYIYKEAKQIIDKSNKAVAKAKKLEMSEKTTICVGTSLLNPCKVFMDLWYSVNNKFPQFKISIVPFKDDHNDILSVIDNIGSRFDFIVGVCDSAQWLSRCSFYKLGEYKKCVAVPYTHPLAKKKRLKITDLYGETLMMVKQGDSKVNDRLRNILISEHPEINIEDTPHFYDIDVYNKCVQTNNLLLNLECWSEVHPSLKTLPVEWDFTIPYGLMYSINPSKSVLDFLEALKSVRK